MAAVSTVGVATASGTALLVGVAACWQAGWKSTSKVKSKVAKQAFRFIDSTPFARICLGMFVKPEQAASKLNWLESQPVFTITS
jgi:hypothetical protein